MIYRRILLLRQHTWRCGSNQGIIALRRRHLLLPFRTFRIKIRLREQGLDLPRHLVGLRHRGSAGSELLARSLSSALDVQTSFTCSGVIDVVLIAIPFSMHHGLPI